MFSPLVSVELYIIITYVSLLINMNKTNMNLYFDIVLALLMVCLTEVKYNLDIVHKVKYSKRKANTILSN